MEVVAKYTEDVFTAPPHSNGEVQWKSVNFVNSRGGVHSPSSTK